jgi:hypothetical protein
MLPSAEQRAKSRVRAIRANRESRAFRGWRDAVRGAFLPEPPKRAERAVSRSEIRAFESVSQTEPGANFADTTTIMTQFPMRVCEQKMP